MASWEAGHGGKAEWQTSFRLLGQNLMACLLPKCEGGKDTRVLKNKRHVCCDFEDGEGPAGTCSGSSAWIPLLLLQKGRSQPCGRSACLWGGGQGSVCCFTFGSLNPGTSLLLWKRRTGLSVIKWSQIYPVLYKDSNQMKVVKVLLQRHVNYSNS